MNRRHTGLPPGIAQAIVDPVRPGFRVADVVLRTGGEVSTVYEIRGTGTARPLVLKIYDPRWRPKLIKEVYLYRLLARRGIGYVPRVLSAAPAGVPGLPSAFLLMTLLDGRPLCDVRAGLDATGIAEVYRRMGELLAAVHRIRHDRWGYLTTRVVDARPTNAAYMTDQFARRLRAFAELGGDPALARAVERHVGRHADLFAGCSAPVLCHNDFHEGNVLVSRSGGPDGGGRWQVTGCVDVENAVSADPMLDVARTDYHALRDDPARRRAFLDGYGALPPGWADRVAIYHLHHALELWNWAAATGKPADRSRATTDLEEIISGRCQS